MLFNCSSRGIVGRHQEHEAHIAEIRREKGIEGQDDDGYTLPEVSVVLNTHKHFRQNIRFRDEDDDVRDEQGELIVVHSLLRAGSFALIPVAPVVCVALAGFSQKLETIMTSRTFRCRWDLRGRDHPNDKPHRGGHGRQY